MQQGRYKRGGRKGGGEGWWMEGWMGGQGMLMGWVERVC